MYVGLAYPIFNISYGLIKVAPSYFDRSLIGSFTLRIDHSVQHFTHSSFLYDIK